MFDIAWSHILLIGVIALLVIGPKDLPKVLRTLGIWVGRARAIAREFQGSLDQMIREAELEDVRKEVEKASKLDLDHEIEKHIDPGGAMKETFSEPAISDHTVPAPEILPPSEPETPAGETTAAPAEPTPAAEPAAKSGTHA
jgi:sec-independent protein translocase protein TatB